jgi:hypothetical protein
MPSPLFLSATRSIPVDVATAYDAVLPMPLTRVFSRRFAALPPIKEVRDQEGAWGTVGQTRTIVLADRGTMRETLTSVTPGSSFGYRIEPLTGVLKPLVRDLDGLWSFAPAGNGVAVTWQWTIRPSTGGALVMSALGRMWQGYARQALEEIEKALLDG